MFNQIIVTGPKSYMLAYESQLDLLGLRSQIEAGNKMAFQIAMALAKLHGLKIERQPSPTVMNHV